MTTKPRISVIIPVYKCEEYLESCVSSVLNQTFSDFEIILVDDGSPDNCGEICDALAEKHSNITVIHQENQGQAAARNNGVKVARGEWLHFVDSDDLIHPQMLEIFYDTVVKNNVNLVMCSAVQDEKIPDDFYANKKVEFKTLEMNENNFFHLYKHLYYYWVIWGKLIHKSIYEKHPLAEGRIYEDNAIVCKWLYEAKKVALTNEQLYFYKINSNSTINSDFSLKKMDSLWAIEEQIKFYENTEFNKMKKTLYENYAVACAKMYYRLLENQEWTEEAKKLKKKLRAFFQKKRKFIKFNEDWVFNMVYGIVYPKPIRIIFRLKRFIKTRKR